MSCVPDHNTWDLERIPHRCILKVYQTKDCEICAIKIGSYGFNIRGDKLIVVFSASSQYIILHRYEMRECPWQRSESFN